MDRAEDTEQEESLAPSARRRSNLIQIVIYAPPGLFTYWQWKQNLCGSEAKRSRMVGGGGALYGLDSINPSGKTIWRWWSWPSITRQVWARPSSLILIEWILLYNTPALVPLPPFLAKMWFSGSSFPSCRAWISERGDSGRAKVKAWHRDERNAPGSFCSPCGLNGVIPRLGGRNRKRGEDSKERGGGRQKERTGEGKS